MLKEGSSHICLCNLSKKQFELIEVLVYRAKEIERLTNEANTFSPQELITLNTKLQRLYGFLHYYYEYHYCENGEQDIP